jgi:hypothetical protein
MKYAIRSAGSVLVVAVVLTGCEGADRGLAPEVQPLASAAPVTCAAVTDPQGDAVASDGSGVRGEPYQDIVRAEVCKKGGRFVFVMDVGGPLPAGPVGPGETILQEWSWNINSDPATFPAGFPFPDGSAAPPEFIVWVLWDGRTFTASVIDRRPLLAGRDARITPAPFHIEGATVKVWVGAGLLGKPEAFAWIARTNNWPSPPGTSDPQTLDRAPDAAPAPWPG